MTSSQSDDGVKPITANETLNILKGGQSLRFAWSTGNGFSFVLVDKDIKSIQEPLPSPATALQGCYQISKASGKGLGMFATKDINPGDCILVENPLLVVPKQIMPDFPFSSLLIHNLLIMPYHNTPASEAFFSLANSYPFTKGNIPFDCFADGMKSANTLWEPMPFTCNVAVPEGATVSEVKDTTAMVETNAMDILIRDPKCNAPLTLTYRAVFLNASRINHSCSPNASYYFDFESWALSLTADRVISAGEEITIGYSDVNLLDPRELRLKTLNETRGFQCVCETCHKPNEPAEIVESDKRREELRTWARTAPVMWKWSSDFSLKDDYMLLPHARALFLMFKEGLYLPTRKGHLVAIMDAYAALGEQYYESQNDVHSARDLEHLVANPKSHPHWKLRIKAKEASQSKRKNKELSADNNEYLPIAPTPTASRSLIGRNIYLGDFKCPTVLDSVTLSLIPDPSVKPYPGTAPKDAFKIAPTLNKGLAMAARKDIASGGMILAESPALVCPIKVPEMDPPIHQFLYDRLDPEQREAVLSLANNKPPEVCSKYEGIIPTNCIQVKLPIEECLPEILSYHAGVFLNISRCNHSCRPNAMWHWDLESWSMGLTATRSIRAGEEITVAYIDNSEPREARRKKLFKMY